ncbi:hypothetical protein EJ03DRAFT_382906 [Teratosphaeria nubilosa]|uniref:F-box domain-containing protein n=1 Tax=Teratosphaeria nubilosa TaxID=161662 RepID=A0A6G1L956_9PEZI|nr:hypothetical protein EJ03DRAFT_382906 [Teratosphaeria nubilosa]
MEVASSMAASASEMTAPATLEDDNRHYAITASQVPKALGATVPISSPLQSPGLGHEGSSKDIKSFGTRFHEDFHETDALPSPRLRSTRLLKIKGKEAMLAEQEEKKPLQLLDLPVDILKDIVKEVTHTNDLTSLALCHSALHRLTIPHIYSRFDIVWPDSSVNSEPRSGVDALTYGLATLVMAEEIFGEAPSQRREGSNRFVKSGQGRASEMTIRRRRGNHYAQFTRKFSLGNGPVDWVQEYLITKEGGKMLGTLVALAVARMRALETFIWDMPTGILRDVWLSLSSLGDRDDGRPCRLEKVWVRWHDNSTNDVAQQVPLQVPPAPPPINMHAMPQAHMQPSLGSGMMHPIHPAALNRVEHPSFSVLPPLKSLSVLDIDELAYLDEMAVLIAKSLDKLRELRVGIARHAMTREWVTVWEGDHLQQVDHDFPTAGSLTIGEKRLGGVLGTLTGLVCDMRRPKIALPDRTRRRMTRPSTPAQSMAPSENHAPPHEAVLGLQQGQEQSPTSPTFVDAQPDLSPKRPVSSELPQPSSSHLSADSALEDDPLVACSRQASPGPTPPSPEGLPTSPVLPPPSLFELAVRAAREAEQEIESPDIQTSEQQYLDNMLQLEILELERVPLSVPVLQRVLDWTRLTSLTLLHCQNHEQLWKTLRRTFAPTPKSPTYPAPRRCSTTTPKKSRASHDLDFDYPLKLRKLHTNTVSPSLIFFLKETLAPSSVETLFLQEARTYSSSVTIEAIFRAAIRRHRGSLQKVLIDSSDKGPDGLPTNSSRWRRWMLNRETLAFMCSGRMPALRELGIAMDYRDWHFFLQHLPSIPHLRSLYLPFLADHVHGTNVDPRELALQIVDIVALRPECELCYMGIANKCFEILENKRREFDTGPLEAHLGIQSGVIEDAAGSEEEDQEEEVDDEDLEDGEEVLDDTESEEDDHEDDDGTDDDGEGLADQHAARLRLREILFYDDKVAVFKGRHGRL